MIFAVDGGGTTFKTCLVNDEGELSAIEPFPLEPPKGIPTLKQAVNSIFQKRARECEAKGTPIRAIGFGCRGIIDSEKTTLVTDSGIMNFFSGHSFRELVDSDLPLGAENDAVAATMGENKFGVGKRMKNFILLTLGTGIGGGIIINGKIYKGHTGMAGHLGHFPVNPEGDKCGCGNTGCIETEFSAGAFRRRLAKYNEGKPSGEQIDGTRDLFDKAEAGHEGASAILHRAIFYLARTISGYANSLDPERVILSGGLANAGDYLMKLLVDELKPYLWLKDPAKFIEFSALGDEMGMYGAGAVGASLVED